MMAVGDGADGLAGAAFGVGDDLVEGGENGIPSAALDDLR
jgi:hypothetical protein